MAKESKALTKPGLHLDLPARLTPTQLVLFENVDYAGCRDILLKVAQVTDRGNWWLGKIINHIEEHFSEEASQAIAESHISIDRYNAVKWVDMRVPVKTRVAELTWSHHRAVASLEPELQECWLRKALENNWSVKELRDALKQTEEEPEPEEEGEEKESGCQVCAADKAPMKVCSKCASVAVRALETTGIPGAIELLKQKPSKPQLALLIWAFDQIAMPQTFADEEAEASWVAQYDAIKKTIEKAAEKEQQKAA